MKELIKRLRDTASKGVSVWGDLQLEAADALERLTSGDVALPARLPGYCLEQIYTEDQLIDYGARYGCRWMAS